MNDKTVLIAGAGPAGLSAASVLAQAGVSVDVFETEDHLPETLRASTFHPPTLDMLKPFGASDKLLEMGLTSPLVQFRTRESGKFAEFDFAVISDVTDYPYRVQIEQFRLNQLLYDYLKTQPNAEVHFGCRAVGITQDDSGATLVIERDGRREEVRGAYLIGADGANSIVRRTLDIPFEGFTWEDRFLVLSTSFEFRNVWPDLCNVNYVTDPHQWLFLLRVPALWRVMLPIAPSMSEEEATSTAFTQKVLQGVHQRDTDYEIVHKTLYRVHQRVADKYRIGRIFLAGDAAHINNPLGGMGMNGGIHDGFNLAEKLAQVLLGAAGEELLDLYEKQRRPIALEYVNFHTIQNKKNLEEKDPVKRRAIQEDLARRAADRSLAREYVLNAAMISSLRKAATITL